MLHLSIQRRTIRNKFRRFLGRISAKTCLKWIILLVNPKNHQAMGTPPSDLCLDSMTKECVRSYSHISQNIFLVDSDACQFGGKTKLIFYIFCSPPSPLLEKTFSRHWIKLTKRTFFVNKNAVIAKASELHPEPR